MFEWLVLSQLILTACLTGIIWQVQLLTYPQFLKVPADSFPAYHRGHTFRMGCVVIPPMLLEIGGATLLLWLEPSVYSAVGLALVGLIWLTTAIFQVPRHRRLGRGKDLAVIRGLILSNWIRTVLWSIRLGWLIVWVVALVRP